MDISIRGLQEAQRSNMRDMAAVKTTGGLGRAIQITHQGLTMGHGLPA